jgi:hypothetical protein
MKSVCVVAVLVCTVYVDAVVLLARYVHITNYCI